MNIWRPSTDQQLFKPRDLQAYNNLRDDMRCGLRILHTAIERKRANAGQLSSTAGNQRIDQ
jgi:hypothetical protein